MEINERVKRVRERLNLSMADFGNAIGLSHSGISAIEYGTRKVTEKHIKLICAVFNVSENWLRTGEGEMFENQKNPCWTN
jgi:transcriptional regulator with XRE-family HTH domain